MWKGIERRGKRRVVALKKCFNAFASSSDSQRTYREISYLLKLRGHVNVVTLRHVIRAKHDLDIYLVFESARPESLFFSFSSATTLRMKKLGTWRRTCTR